jgi:hypothetical protein
MSGLALAFSPSPSVPSTFIHSTNIYWVPFMCQNLQARVHWISIQYALFHVDLHYVYGAKDVLRDAKNLAKH